LTYIGKTTDLERRKYQHGARIVPGTWEPTPLPNRTNSELKMAEQAMINAELARLGIHLPVPSLGLANKINSIAPKNWDDIMWETLEFGAP